MKDNELYRILQDSLPSSDAKDRQDWAQIIVDAKHDLKYLSQLAFEEKNVASRYMWLLSDVGQLSPTTLHSHLPYLLQIMDKLSHLNCEVTYANYWLIAGVPEQDEPRVMNVLFNWLQSPDTNVTTKSRSLLVLFKLSKKHPDIEQELKVILEDQLDKNTENFKKRAMKNIQCIAH